MSDSNENNSEPHLVPIDEPGAASKDEASSFEDFVQHMPPPLRDAFRGGAPNPQIMAIMQTAFSASMYAGPLPPAEQLKAYEDVLPGSADRIIRMAEDQAHHRQSIETAAVSGGTRRSWWGLWTGFSISVIALGLSALLVLKGHNWEGVFIGGIDIVALAGVFVYGRSDQRKEREQKDSASQIPNASNMMIDNSKPKGSN